MNFHATNPCLALCLAVLAFGSCKRGDNSVGDLGQGVGSCLLTSYETPLSNGTTRTRRIAYDNRNRFLTIKDEAMTDSFIYAPGLIVHQRSYANGTRNVNDTAEVDASYTRILSYRYRPDITTPYGGSMVYHYNTAGQLETIENVPDVGRAATVSWHFWENGDMVTDSSIRGSVTTRVFDKGRRGQISGQLSMLSYYGVASTPSEHIVTGLSNTSPTTTPYTIQYYYQFDGDGKIIADSSSLGARNRYQYTCF